MQTKLKLLLSVVCLILIVHTSYAQNWSPYPTGGFNYQETDAGLDGICIGTFSTPSVTPSAALDIVIPFLPSAGPIYSTGEAFRSTSDQAWDHYWRMFSYDLATFRFTEKFHLLNPRVSNDIHLNVVQKGAMNFLTFNAPRMIINDAGRVGIGDYTDPLFVQSSLLNQFVTAGDNMHRFTSSSATHGGITFGLKNNTFGAIEQYEASPFLLSVALNKPIPSYVPVIRVKIWGGLVQADPAAPTSFINKIGINRSEVDQIQNSHLISMLTMGNDPFSDATSPSVSGNRLWMDVGTYMASNSDYDNMYVGLKDEGNSENDAIINWGDNVVQNEEASIQSLRFIFTSVGTLPGSYASNPSATFHGLEVARMTSHGDMGIGDFYNNKLPIADPAARLEILDNKNLYANYPNTSLNRAQLRLTFKQTSASSAGIFTDFQTTSLGDLYIHASSYATATPTTPTYRNVGINTPIPSNTLEIDYDAGLTTHIHNYAGLGGGKSGLTFNDLASTSASSGTSLAISNGKVLSVDLNGVVVLVDDAGASSGDVVACASGVASNYLTKWIPGTKTICKTEGVYEESTSGFYYVGIGVGTSPNNKLHVGGDINVDAITDVYKIHNIQFVRANSNQSTFVGFNAGSNTTNGGNNSTLIGYNAGYSAAFTNSGVENTFVGDRAGAGNTTGGLNCFVGQTSGTANTTGQYNAFIGNQSGHSNTTGGYNVFGGYVAGFHNTTAAGNVYLGSSAGYAATTAASNVFVGKDAGVTHQTGDGNTFIGAYVLDDTYGSANAFASMTTVLGYGSSAAGTVGTPSLTNATAIGANSKVECDNCLVLGKTGGASQVSVGIGYTNPSTAPTTTSEPFLLYVNSATAITNPPCLGCASSNSAFFNGNLYSATTWYPSDSILKNNVQPFLNASARQMLDQLRPVTYTFNAAIHPQLSLPTGLQYGLIAEEVEQVLPGLVRNITTPAVFDTIGDIVTPEFTFKAMNYVGLIPLLLSTAKDQQNAIDSLQQQLNELKTQVNACCHAGNTGSTGSARLSVNLENTAAIILDQNTPNPFAEQTTISFIIPDDVKNAQIMFYEKSGRIMKSVVVQERGNGSLTVYAEKLSSGIYSYSLIADGKLIDTKKMVCTK